jgi:hypothetical protein
MIKVKKNLTFAIDFNSKTNCIALFDVDDIEWNPDNNRFVLTANERGHKVFSDCHCFDILS